MPETADKTAALTGVRLRTSIADGCILRILEGPDSGVSMPLSERALVVGSGADADLQVHDSTVSGRHLQITLTAEGLLVEDLGSTNGTLYLNTRLQRAVVPLGAVLHLGKTRMELASGKPSAGAAMSQANQYGAILGGTPVMRRLYAALERLAPFDYPTLLLGETGVGKEMIATEIQRHSSRAAGPYEICDCTALPPNLAESELFGHVRGAFTGAHADHVGIFERGNRGTVFLDEIGELPLELQAKMLRVLESGDLRRVGAQTSIKVDVRIIAATNRDLGEEVTQKRFRQDLLYRLNTVTVLVPPLRERREDIPMLIEAFLRAGNVTDFQLSSETLELFTTGYDWPGNVRELRNAVARIHAMGSLPDALGPGAAGGEDTGDLRVDTSATFQDAKRTIVEAFERDYLAAKLKQANDNISQAARDAGVERTHFKRLLRKHGLLRGDTTE